MIRSLLLVLFVVSCCFGQSLWQFSTNVAITCMIENNGETVIFGTQDGTIVWVNATTGTVLHSKATTLRIGTCVSDGTFAYFGSNTSPSNITKVRLDYHNTSSTSVSITNFNYLTSSVYSNGYIYFGTNTCPSSCILHISAATLAFASSYCTTADGIHCFATSAGTYQDLVFFSFNTTNGIASSFNATRVSPITNFDYATPNTYISTSVILGNIIYFFGTSSYVISRTLPLLNSFASQSLNFGDISAVAVYNNDTIYYASKYGNLATWSISTGLSTPTVSYGGSFTSAVIRGDFIYFAGAYSNGTARILYNYIGLDCPTAYGGMLLNGDSRQVFSSVPTCDTPNCIPGNITCINGTIIGNSTFQYTSCPVLNNCDCTYDPVLNYTLAHNVGTFSYIIPTPFCGNCSDVASSYLVCKNGTLYSNGNALNGSQVRSNCVSNCTNAPCTVTIAGNTVIVPHNTTRTFYSASTQCLSCASIAVPVYCESSLLNVSNTNTLFDSCTAIDCYCSWNNILWNSSVVVYQQPTYCGNCTEIQAGFVNCSSTGNLSGNITAFPMCTTVPCMDNCTIMAGNKTVTLLHNTTTYFYNVSESCGDCNLNKIAVTCFNSVTNINNNLYLECMPKSCDTTVSLQNAINATLIVSNDVIVMMFPQAANYTATYSIANSSNSNTKHSSQNITASFVS